jgi:two-component sensor histidine kinase
LLKIDWIEQGGPAVAEPQRRGFGSKLIEGSIAAEHGGSARLAFEPSGLRCEIVMPLEAATADVDQEPQGVDWSV